MRWSPSASIKRFTLLAVVGLAGCGAVDAPAPLVDVDGVLLINDQPAANARVGFHRLDGPPTVCPVGIVDRNGVFRLTTRQRNDGAPAGEYAVTVVWPHDVASVDDCGCFFDPLLHDRLRGAYCDASTTTLRATVRPGERILLHGTVGAQGWNLPRRSSGASHP